MKRTRQIALLCSFLLTLQSGVMGVLLWWFNRFSTDVFYRIPGIQFRLLTLYFGVLLGLTCLYTAYFYYRPKLLAAAFFIIIGILGVSNTIMLVLPQLRVHFLFVGYIALLSIGFIYVGVSGFYYHFKMPIESKVSKEEYDVERPNKQVSTSRHT